jgi:hypothetical protein
MTINNKPHRAIAVLSLPVKVEDLINLAQVIVKGMTGNANFPTPTPPVATVQAALTDLVTAQAAATVRTKGAAALRNEKKQALVTLLEEWRTYVQSTADASPENGPSIIESSGMALRKTPVRKPLGFHAKLGAVSGSVKIVAPAAAQRASYEWQYSTDGKTWVAMPSTLQAKTSLSGLTPQTTVQFRYRAVVKSGEENWSQPISILVL